MHSEINPHRSSLASAGLSPFENQSTNCAAHPILRYLPMLLGAGYLLGCLFILFSADIFERDFDEGAQLMRAALVERGYYLYSDIWSDQPPLFAYLLAKIFALFGESVQIARIVVAVFAATLVLTLSALCASISGWRAAVALVLLIVASDYFLRLSMSSMIGLPALSFATISVFFVQRFLSSSAGLAIVFSALAFAASLATKMFTLPIAVAILITFTYNWMTTSSRRFLTAEIAWGLLVVSFLIGAFSAWQVDWQQLVETHWSARGTQMFSLQGIPAVRGFLEQNWSLAALASLSSILFAMRREGWIVLPLAWFITAAIGVAGHTPVFYHHAPLLALPLCWLAAAGLGMVSNLQAWKRRREQPMFLALALVTAVLLYQLPGKITAAYQQAKGKQCQQCSEILQFLRAHSTAGSWIITDRLMFAFRTNLLVPPYTIFSWKRLTTTALKDEELLWAKTKYAVGIILLNRGPVFCHALRKYFETGYTQALSIDIDSDPHTDIKILAVVMIKDQERGQETLVIPCER